MKFIVPTVLLFGLIGACLWLRDDASLKVATDTNPPQISPASADQNGLKAILEYDEKALARAQEDYSHAKGRLLEMVSDVDVERQKIEIEEANERVNEARRTLDQRRAQFEATGR